MSENWITIYDSLDTRGLWLLAPWQTRLLVRGADARRFLQNFCSNDVLGASPRSVIEAFFLNTKGHVLHHGVLAIGEEQVVIYLVGSNATELMEHLSRYVIREKVEFELIETPWWLAIGGPWGAIGEDQSPTPLADLCQVHQFPLFRLPAWIIESAMPQETLESALNGAGYLPADGVEGGSRVFETLRIESGLPLPRVDYPEGTLPQELDRDRQAIHFEKGCYLGQETVARLDALGHVNKLLRGVRFADGAPPLGAELSNGAREVGRISSLTYSPTLRSDLGLAIVRREAAQEGAELSWEHGIATVVTLPLEADRDS